MTLGGCAPDQHLLAELENRECSRDREQSQDDDDEQEAAGAHRAGR
jgi:hypothetical protein